MEEQRKKQLEGMLREIQEKKCPIHNIGNRFKNTAIDMPYYLGKAREP